ncbi:MAG: NAD-dependent epimerase/dehydratase family protein [Myxococcota bacterium]|jgi:dTDP-glucose 4,6-dehydratase
MPEKGLVENDLEQIVIDARGAFERLRNARLFITGGTGFWGRWMLESLALANGRYSLGIEAAVLSRDPASFASRAPGLCGQSWLRFVEGDIRTFDFPAGAFTDVIHLSTAASASLNANRPLEMFDTIVEGTRRALDFAVSAGAKRFFLASSGAVYGRQPCDVTHTCEDYTGGPSPTDVGSAYAEGKRAAEYLCTVYGARHGLEIKIARGFAFVGPYLPLDAHYAIGNFIRDALAGGPIIINGDGTTMRSYMYASDMAVWLWSILADGRPGVPYNVGSMEAVSISGMAKTVSAAFSPRPEVIVRKKALPGAPVERYVPDTGRARGDLQLGVAVGLEEAIRRTVEFNRRAV